MGRHSMPKSTNTILSSKSAMGFTGATVFGVIVGSTLPSAFADEAKPAAQEPASVVTVAPKAEETTISATAAASTQYTLQGVKVEAKAPAPAPAPARFPAANPGAALPAYNGPMAPDMAAIPANEALGNKVVAIARQFAGVPYVWAGMSPKGWDCVGFVDYVYAQLGITLPRTPYGVLKAGHVIPASQARPGDVVYWPGHVGIYTGGDMHIAAWNERIGTKEGKLYGRPTFVRVY